MADKKPTVLERLAVVETEVKQIKKMIYGLIVALVSNGMILISPLVSAIGFK